MKNKKTAYRDSRQVDMNTAPSMPIERPPPIILKNPLHYERYSNYQNPVSNPNVQLSNDLRHYQNEPIWNERAATETEFQTLKSNGYPVESVFDVQVFVSKSKNNPGRQYFGLARNAFLCWLDNIKPYQKYEKKDPNIIQGQLLAITTELAQLRQELQQAINKSP
jgi:hypothetical protein